MILGLLVMPVIIYVIGLVRQQKRQGSLRAGQKWRAAAFGSGIFILFIALVSPIDTLNERLFSIHMVQHILLIDFAPPLLAFSAPLGVMVNAFPHTSQVTAGRWWATPGNGIRIVWHWLSHPLTAWVLASGFLWLWHIPALYTQAIENESIHALEHICFMGSGLLLWWNILFTFWRKPNLRGSGVFYMAAYALQSSGLGWLLMLSNTIWYPIYASSAGTLGISPLADQQAAGAIMWVPEMLIYLVGALLMLKGWLDNMENKEENRIEKPANEAKS